MRYEEKQPIMESDPVTGTMYQEFLGAMKSILDLGQFKIGSKNSKEYSYFKSKVMDAIYIAMQNTYDDMEREGIIERCPECEETSGIRNGWKPCSCRGCGYVLKE